MAEALVGTTNAKMSAAGTNAAAAAPQGRLRGDIREPYRPFVYAMVIPRALMNGTGSVRLPPTRMMKCRWHPVDAPVVPTCAIG